MSAALSIFAVICTVHYFYALLQRPKLLASIFGVTGIWKITLAALYRFGVALGIAGLIFLGVKEVAYFVTSARLGIAYDEYLGIAAVVVTIVLLRGFERTAMALARAD